jgi:hypothetical protein
LAKSTDRPETLLHIPSGIRSNRENALLDPKSFYGIDRGCSACRNQTCHACRQAKNQQGCHEYCGIDCRYLVEL